MDINETLKRAIRDSGVSVYQICKETGLDQGAMSRFLSGDVDLRIKSINKLCDYFGLELTATKKRKGLSK